MGSKHDRREGYTDPATNRLIANEGLAWLIQKGDILFPNTQREAEKEFAFNFQDIDNRSFILPIYEYPDDNMLNRFETEQGIGNYLRVEVNLLTHYKI